MSIPFREQFRRQWGPPPHRVSQAAHDAALVRLTGELLARDRRIAELEDIIGGLMLERAQLAQDCIAMAGRIGRGTSTQR